MLYQTGLRGVVLKFHFDLNKAMVSLDVENIGEQQGNRIWKKLVSIQSTMHSEYLPGVIFEANHILENHKKIGRIYVEKTAVCIHDKDTWLDTMIFLKEHMAVMEDFFKAYYDFLEN